MGKRVLVVGGSEEFMGAVYLAAMSALRFGADDDTAAIYRARP